ncbi:hypothetical protein EVAR_33783_1 [Eumeta japonica]|uniref:Regulatory protein zeste n=1 Tax=Eumeta variegata TaxID=151549 RepID=A0A4C1VUV9_EUMVA|nr:hypothetical protein EVAR_33783_1 [Eumeta japonica]
MAVFNNERVTTEQLERLIDFLENNEDLALGHCHTKKGRQRNKKLWDEVALSLNSLGNGAIKDGALWSKVSAENRTCDTIRSYAAITVGDSPGVSSRTVASAMIQRLLAVCATSLASLIQDVHLATKLGLGCNVLNND